MCRPSLPHPALSTAHALARAVEKETAEVPRRRLADTARALSQRYRSGTTSDRPVLTNAEVVAAYAVTRMPATFAATRAALMRAAAAAPGLAPRSQLDIGGGTGAALWAAAEVFDSLRAATVLDQSPHALLLGRRSPPTAPPRRRARRVGRARR